MKHAGFIYSTRALKENDVADDKSKVGKADRDRVSGSEDYEVQALAKKHGVTSAQVRDAIKKSGPMRKDVEATLSSSTKA